MDKGHDLSEDYIIFPDPNFDFAKFYKETYSFFLFLFLFFFGWEVNGEFKLLLFFILNYFFKS